MSSLKPIPGYEGLYSAAKSGFIYSHLKNKCLKPYKSNSGYLYVNLTSNGSKKHKYVHRLILKTYAGESSKHVNHLNGNKEDNRLSNLTYCSRSENMYHAHRTGLLVAPRKITRKELDIMRCLTAFKWTQKEIAELLEVHRNTVYNYLSGRLACK